MTTEPLEPEDDEPESRDATAVIVARGFLEHWASIVQRLDAGEDVAGLRSRGFLSESPRERHEWARAFYDRERAARFAALSVEEVVNRLEPWLKRALSGTGTDDVERDAWLGSLATSEYVLFVEHHGRRGSVRVDAYPGVTEAYYDDLYERTAAGYSVGAYVRLAKSTAEPFTYDEREAVKGGLAADFRAGMESDGGDETWQFAAQADEDEHWVEVDVSELDPSDCEPGEGRLRVV